MQTAHMIARLFLVLALSFVITEAQTFDDPVMSLSHYDDLDRIIDKGFPIEHMELMIHRASMGKSGLDDYYVRRQRQASTLRLLWGAYHFARAESNGINDESPSDQVDHFLSTVLKEKSASGKVILVINWDAYGPSIHRKSMSPAALAQMVEEINKRTGHYPGICTSSKFLQEICSQDLPSEVSQVLARSWLWIQSFDESVPQLPDKSPWKKWTLWFHASHDDKRTADKDSKMGFITPDLSYSSMHRGQELMDWYNIQSWDYNEKKQ